MDRVGIALDCVGHIHVSNSRKFTPQTGTGPAESDTETTVYNVHAPTNLHSSALPYMPRPPAHTINA